VTNNGITPTPDPMTLTDVLPAGLTYQGFSGAGWSCAAAGQTVTCTYAGSLDVGDSVELHLAVLVGSSVVAGSDLVNDVVVSAAGVELTLANNTDEVTVAVIAQSVTPVPPVTPRTTTTTLPPGGAIDVATVDPEGLPITGTPVGRTALAALMLMGAGIGLLALRRRRRGSPTPG
jgi:hypothetical protein